MPKFKIIALSCHSAKTNQIYNSQDIVDGSCFLDHQIQELINGKFIVPVVDDAPAEPITDAPPVEEAPVVTEETPKVEEPVTDTPPAVVPEVKSTSKKKGKK